MRKPGSYIIFERLNRLCGSDKDKKLKYLNRFDQMLPVCIEKMKRAIEEKDERKLMQEVHFISPQLVFFGINDFSLLLEADQKKDGVSFDQLSKQIETSIVKIEKALKEIEDYIVKIKELG